MGFSKQKHWSGLSLPPPGDLPHPGMEPMSLASPALADRFFTTGIPGKPYNCAPQTFQVLLSLSPAGREILVVKKQVLLKKQWKVQLDRPGLHGGLQAGGEAQVSRKMLRWGSCSPPEGFGKGLGVVGLRRTFLEREIARTRPSWWPLCQWEKWAIWLGFWGFLKAQQETFFKLII